MARRNERNASLTPRQPWTDGSPPSGSTKPARLPRAALLELFEATLPLARAAGRLRRPGRRSGCSGGAPARGRAADVFASWWVRLALALSILATGLAALWVPPVLRAMAGLWSLSDLVQVSVRVAGEAGRWLATALRLWDWLFALARALSEPLMTPRVLAVLTLGLLASGLAFRFLRDQISGERNWTYVRPHLTRHDSPAESAAGRDPSRSPLSLGAGRGSPRPRGAAVRRSPLPPRRRSGRLCARPSRAATRCCPCRTASPLKPRREAGGHPHHRGHGGQRRRQRRAGEPPHPARLAGRGRRRRAEAAGPERRRAAAGLRPGGRPAGPGGSGGRAPRRGEPRGRGRDQRRRGRRRARGPRDPGAAGSPRRAAPSRRGATPAAASTSAAA